MPIEHVVQMTGHDLTGLSALYEYVDVSRPSTMPGVRVIAGWKPLPWGQCGEGPVPPTLEALALAGVDLKEVEQVINVLFKITDAGPPQLLLGTTTVRAGELREMLHTTFASMVMYFEERHLAGEMNMVRDAMRKALKQRNMTTGSEDALLIKWGNIIRAQFELDNLSRTSPSGAQEDGTKVWNK